MLISKRAFPLANGVAPWPLLNPDKEILFPLSHEKFAPAARVSSLTNSALPGPTD